MDPARKFFAGKWYREVWKPKINAFRIKTMNLWCRDQNHGIEILIYRDGINRRAHIYIERERERYTHISPDNIR